MNSMAIDIENVIGNKIETENKATDGFFIGYGLSLPRGNYGLVPRIDISSTDSTAWKEAIFEDGKIGAQSGYYLEIGGGLNLAESHAKVKFYYNPIVLCFAKNKISWMKRTDPLFSSSSTDSTKAYYALEVAQRYGISYEPVTKLVAVFYYRPAIAIPISNYKIGYISSTDATAFSLNSTNKSVMAFSHTLGFSISYSFITLSYESYFLKMRYSFTAKYHGPSPTDTEQITTFNGKFPMRTNRIGISIHF
jgi:hypothetical protein